MKRAFPDGPASWLVDVCNHITVKETLVDFREPNDWTIEYEGECEWIATAPGTRARSYVDSMEKAVLEYPLLDERRYTDMQYPKMLDAVLAKARSSGTIINQEDTPDALDLLMASGVEVLEYEPRKFMVAMTDEDFQDLFAMSGNKEDEE